MHCVLLMHHLPSACFFTASILNLSDHLQVLNLRSLKPLDRDTIVKSVRKTHRVVTVEEGWPQCGIGSEITATVNEECFDDLDAAPERITGAEVPMPYAQNLEAAALPQVPDIIRVVKRMMNKQ